MFCGNCGFKLEDWQNFCPRCGTKTVKVDSSSKISDIDSQIYESEKITDNQIQCAHSDLSESLSVNRTNEFEIQVEKTNKQYSDYNFKKTQSERKEDVKVTVSAMNRAYILLCCVSTSLSFFWSAIVSSGDLEDFIPVVIFVELAFIAAAIFFAVNNERHRTNSAKVIILLSLLTIGEVLFLLFNIDNVKSSVIIEIFFSIVTVSVYFLLRRENITLLASAAEASTNICCSETTHDAFAFLIKDMWTDTEDGKWRDNVSEGKREFVCNHCGNVIAYANNTEISKDTNNV